ncbi:MAG: DUF2232 domain-containing protein [candidate division Zixibacteria bacterium]|nr:DUF2232 domain-containing protein [candidate division Zixibacteria bacterium]
MHSRQTIPSMAAILIVSIAFWSNLPLVNYVCLNIMMLFVMLSVIERKFWIILGASLIAIVLTSILDTGYNGNIGAFLGLLTFGVVSPAIVAVIINSGRKAGLAYGAGALIIAAVSVFGYIQGMQEIHAFIDTSRDIALRYTEVQLQTAGFGAERIAEAKDEMEYIGRLMKRFAPGFLILTGISHLFIQLLCVEWYYMRRDSYFPGFGNFTYWKTPEYLLYILGAGLLIRLFSGGYIEIAVDNFLLIFSVVYGVCGLSLLEYLLRKLKLPLYIKIVFYVGLTLSALGGYLITVIAGVFDSYFDYRKVKAHTLG